MVNNIFCESIWEVSIGGLISDLIHGHQIIGLVLKSSSPSLSLRFSMASTIDAKWNTNKNPTSAVTQQKDVNLLSLIHHSSSKSSKELLQSLMTTTSMVMILVVRMMILTMVMTKMTWINLLVMSIMMANILGAYIDFYFLGVAFRRRLGKMTTGTGQAVMTILRVSNEKCAKGNSVYSWNGCCLITPHSVGHSLRYIKVATSAQQP